MSTRFIPCIARGWLQEEVYGWRHAPSIASCKIPYLYAKAMMYASGVGPAKLAQRKHVAGMLSAHFSGNLESNLLEYVEHFDRFAAAAPALPTMDAIPRPLPGVNARVIVYDAVSTALADGVVHDECSATADIAEVASALGVPAATAKRIAELCEREAAVEARRRRLLIGNEAARIA